MSRLSVWLMKGERSAFLRLAFWTAGLVAVLIVGVLAYEYSSRGREYLQVRSPDGRWDAVATETAGLRRVWVHKEHLEYSPMDLVWRARELRPAELQWIGDDSLLVLVDGKASALAGVELGEPTHRFLDVSGASARMDQVSFRRIGVSTSLRMSNAETR